MARWSSTGRSRVAMTTLTLGRASDMVRPVRVAVAQAQRAGDEGNDLPVAGRELGLPGLVEAEVEPALVKPLGVAGNLGSAARLAPPSAGEGELLGEAGP